MGHFLDVTLSFPVVVYTVLLGVSLVYWVFVMVGAIHLDADGAGDAALEGGVKGLLEGAADHAGQIGHHAGDIGDVGDADLDLDGDVGDGHGGAQGIMAALKLRSAPATVVLSLVVLWSWIFAMLGMQAMEGFPAEGISSTLARVAILVLAPVVALFPTSILVRPLAKIFTPGQAAKHESLVGKVCTIRTGTVTQRFGEAFVEDGGAGLVVRVRIDEGAAKLGRGDQALIVEYDEARGEFTVAPMTGLLEERAATETAAQIEHEEEAVPLRRV